MVALWVDPLLAEEAVFACMRRLAGVSAEQTSAWNREREAIYAAAGAAARPRAFAALAERWFERLDLARPLRAALARTPHVRERVGEVRLHRALRRSQEGSELYRDAGSARLVFGLTPERFADPSALEELCLCECLYAEDLLNPERGFAPGLGPEIEGDPVRTELVRDRLRVLWAARVAGRLAALRGAPPPAEPPPAFRRAFGNALEREELDALHARTAAGALATFPELLAAARG